MDPTTRVRLDFDRRARRSTRARDRKRLRAPFPSCRPPRRSLTRGSHANSRQRDFPSLGRTTRDPRTRTDTPELLYNVPIRRHDRCCSPLSPARATHDSAELSLLARSGLGGSTPSNMALGEGRDPLEHTSLYQRAGWILCFSVCGPSNWNFGSGFRTLGSLNVRVM